MLYVNEVVIMSWTLLPQFTRTFVGIQQCGDDTLVRPGKGKSG